MKDIGKVLVGALVISFLIKHVNMQEDVHCIFQPPLENGRLIIPINSHQVFVCDHIPKGEDRHNWSMMNISHFDSEEPDIRFVKQDNATCLQDYDTLCDRIMIIFTPTSTEHDNKQSEICTLFGTPTIKHCSKNFAVEIRQETPSKHTTIAPSLTQTTREQIQTPTTNDNLVSTRSALSQATDTHSAEATASTLMASPINTQSSVSTKIPPTTTPTLQPTPATTSVTVDSTKSSPIIATSQQITPSTLLIGTATDEQRWVITERTGSVWNLINNLIQTVLLLLVYPIIIWRVTKHLKTTLITGGSNSNQDVMGNEEAIYTLTNSEEIRRESIEMTITDSQED